MGESEEAMEVEQCVAGTCVGCGWKEEDHKLTRIQVGGIAFTLCYACYAEFLQMLADNTPEAQWVSKRDGVEGPSGLFFPGDVMRDRANVVESE